MIKLVDILNEVEEKQLEEGWKENILATAMAASALFGGTKASSAQGKNQPPEKPRVTQQATSNVLNVDFGSIFPSGRYIIKGDNEKQLQDKLEQIGKYVAKNPNANYKVEIISSESQVPNYDAEKTGKPKLNTGELAQKRAEAAKFAIEKYFAGIKDLGGFGGKVDIAVAPVQIGKEKFTQGVDNKDDAKYSKDQFVKLKVSAETNKNTVKYDPYAAYSHEGEILYKDNKAYAMAFYPSRATKDITQGGGLSTGYQDVLLRIIDPGLERRGKSFTGNINEKGVYVQDYKIPWDKWNTTTGTTNRLSQQMMDEFEDYKVSTTKTNVTSRDIAP